HATPITVCQRPPRRRPLHPGPAVVACRKSLARKESRRGLSHPRSSPHTQRIAESKRAAPSRLYLDLYTNDRKSEVERLVMIGATRYPWRYKPHDDFVVLEDPDGNLFCVVQVAE